MRFPTIDEVAAELRSINEQTLEDDDDDDGIDVRLQVYPDGDWAVRSGSSDYDQDHRGHWGAASVPGNDRRFSAKDVARGLIEQAREHKATGGDDDDLQENRVAAKRRKPTKEIQDQIDTLSSWMSNYDHGPEEFPTLVWRILASLPGGDQAEDMGYKTFNIGWKEADLIGKMLEAIQDKQDVEDLIDGLMNDGEEEDEEDDE
jgi:hypothetical protein